nr:uncharacterized protein LOC123762003 [Procambarus clarkii]
MGLRLGRCPSPPSNSPVSDVDSGGDAVADGGKISSSVVDVSVIWSVAAESQRASLGDAGTVRFLKGPRPRVLMDSPAVGRRQVEPRVADDASAEVDLAVGPFIISADRADVVDFTETVFIDYSRIMGARGQAEVDPWGFLFPLEPLVWAAILATLLVLPFVVFLMSYCLSGNMSAQGNWLLVTLDFIRMLLLQDIMGPADWWWERVVMVVWGLVTVVLTQSYAGNLMALLAVRHISQPYQSRQQVLDDPSVTIIWLKGSAIEDILHSTSCSTEQSVFSQTVVRWDLGSPDIQLVTFLNKLLKSSIVYALLHSKNDYTSRRCSVYIQQPYSPQEAQALKVAAWTPHRGLTLTSSLPLFPDKFSKLSNRPNLVVVSESYPTHEAVMVDDPKVPGRKVLRFFSAIANVLQLLADTTNFTYTYVRPPDGLWGSQKKDGSWSGMVGMVSREEVDIGLGLFTIGTLSAEVMDFTWPVTIESETLLGGRGRPEVDPWGFLFPLEPLVWAAILAALLVLPLTMFLMSSCTSLKTLAGWMDDIFKFLSLILNQGRHYLYFNILFYETNLTMKLHDFHVFSRILVNDQVTRLRKTDGAYTECDKEMCEALNASFHGVFTTKPEQLPFLEEITLDERLSDIEDILREQKPHVAERLVETE